MTYVEKTSYFVVVPLGHTIAYGNVDHLFRNDKYISYLFYVAYKIMIYKKYSNFIDVAYEVFYTDSLRGFWQALV